MENFLSILETDINAEGFDFNEETLSPYLNNGLWKPLLKVNYEQLY